MQRYNNNVYCNFVAASMSSAILLKHGCQFYVQTKQKNAHRLIQHEQYSLTHILSTQLTTCSALCLQHSISFYIQYQCEN